MNAYRGLLAAADADQSNAGELRNLLREGRVRQVLNLRQRHCSRRSCAKRQDRRVRRIHLAVDRRRGQIVRQE